MSLAYNNNFLHLPIIDLWAYRLLDILKLHNYSLTVKPRRFNYITTVDLDSAYAFKHKGLLRVTFAAFKSLLSNGKPHFLQRFRVVLGLAPDPFDIYDDLIQIEIELDSINEMLKTNHSKELIDRQEYLRYLLLSPHLTKHKNKELYRLKYLHQWLL